MDAPFYIVQYSNARNRWLNIIPDKHADNGRVENTYTSEGAADAARDAFNDTYPGIPTRVMRVTPVGVVP